MLAKASFCNFFPFECTNICWLAAACIIFMCDEVLQLVFVAKWIHINCIQKTIAIFNILWPIQFLYIVLEVNIANTLNRSRCRYVYTICLRVLAQTYLRHIIICNLPELCTNSWWLSRHAQKEVRRCVDTTSIEWPEIWVLKRFVCIRSVSGWKPACRGKLLSCLVCHTETAVIVFEQRGRVGSELHVIVGSAVKYVKVELFKAVLIRICCPEACLFWQHYMSRACPRSNSLTID